MLEVFAYQYCIKNQDNQPVKSALIFFYFLQTFMYIGEASLYTGPLFG